MRQRRQISSARPFSHPSPNILAINLKHVREVPKRLGVIAGSLRCLGKLKQVCNLFGISLLGLSQEHVDSAVVTLHRVFACRHLQLSGTLRTNCWNELHAMAPLLLVVTGTYTSLATSKTMSPLRKRMVDAMTVRDLIADYREKALRPQVFAVQRADLLGR